MDNQLLFEIVKCPNIPKCFNKNNDVHPCSKIVNNQNVTSINKFQVPEPWSGEIKSAVLLFISSNPSINKDELYPNRNWHKLRIVDFFTNRFNGKSGDWVKNNLYVLQKNGKYGKTKVSYWASIKKTASYLLKREARPGKDYALTELVHCKSKSEFGVSNAIKECTMRYLENILEISDAKVILGIGSLVKKYFEKTYILKKRTSRISEIKLNGKVRFLIFLPHPNARVERKTEKILSKKDIYLLNEFLNKSVLL